MNVEFLETPIGPQKKTSEYLAEKKKKACAKMQELSPNTGVNFRFAIYIVVHREPARSVKDTSRL